MSTTSSLSEDSSTWEEVSSLPDMAENQQDLVIWNVNSENALNGYSRLVQWMRIPDQDLAPIHRSKIILQKPKNGCQTYPGSDSEAENSPPPITMFRPSNFSSRVNYRLQPNYETTYLDNLMTYVIELPNGTYAAVSVLSTFWIIGSACQHNMSSFLLNSSLCPLCSS